MLSRRKIFMLNYRLMRILLTAALCALLATIAAAQRDVSAEAFKGLGQLKKREERAAKDIDKYAVQLDKTERALTRLSRAKSDELKNRYEAFFEELKKLEEAQARATISIDKMKTTGVEYFSSWEKANASISDEDLREIAANRRSRSLTKHIVLAKVIGDIGLQVQPFMSSLRDLRAFLGADLSPNNVRLAGERIQACQAEAQALKSSIAEAQTMLKRLLNEMPG